MAIKLGLNLNPFVNRFAEPQGLIDVLAERNRDRPAPAHPRIHQPGVAAATVRRLTAEMSRACAGAASRSPR